jgi:hypothetical protein
MSLLLQIAQRNKGALKVEPEIQPNLERLSILAAEVVDGV